VTGAEHGDDPGFEMLTAKISRDRGFGCASYKEKCLRRRIAVRMRARGVHTYGDYARLLDHDTGEYERLLDALTINVTKLFRNWETYDAIERLVVPELLRRPDPALRVWSAGCSSGEEPYSLAILFHRQAERAGVRAPLARRLDVLGSDIDRGVLAAAERGVYQPAAFADTPADLRRRYFQAEEGGLGVVPEIRSLVRFDRRDLLADPPPAGGMHLITCRNVIIYFDRATQEALFERFHQALAPGGFLVLGKVETLLGHTRTLFATVEPRERIFRKQ
jgi:chemotaxis methyl-accepting protein methylase